MIIHILYDPEKEQTAFKEPHRVTLAVSYQDCPGISDELPLRNHTVSVPSKHIMVTRLSNFVAYIF